MEKKILIINGQHLNVEQSGGAGQYSKQLYNRMIDLDNGDDFRNFDIFFSNFPLNKHSGISNKKINIVYISDAINRIVSQCCPPFLCKRIKCIEKEANNNFAIKNIFSDKKSEIFLHELTNYTTINEIGRFNAFKKKVLIVTFLDIQDFFYPEYFTDKALRERLLLYSFYKEKSDFFIAISYFTKQTMVDKLKIHQDKIKVIHLASDDLVQYKISDKTNDWINSFGRYWIYPAKLWKHKNHDFLIESIGKLRDLFQRLKIKLILTGGFSDKNIHQLKKMINENRLHDIVNVLGFVSSEQLQALVKHADYLIFPSLFEGFGMPILEAMTLGCPVVSSNASSLPEIGGDAAIYFDPTDKENFIALVESILSGTEIDRTVLVQKGFQNCKRFSWDKTYRETVKVYNELL